MPLTRECKETVQARLRSDRKYRKELLREGVECLLAGDVESEAPHDSAGDERQRIRPELLHRPDG